MGFWNREILAKMIADKVYICVDAYGRLTICDNSVDSAKIKDGGVGRVDLEVPSTSQLAYLRALGKAYARMIWTKRGSGLGTLYETVLTDKKVVQLFKLSTNFICNVNRWYGVNTLYYNYFDASLATADHKLYKVVNGTETELASEAVDLSGIIHASLQVSGSALKSCRSSPGQVRDVDTIDPCAWSSISATDTSISSGRFGNYYYSGDSYAIDFGMIRDVASQLPNAVAVIEAEVAGDGVNEPFRPLLVSDLREVDPTLHSVPPHVAVEAKRYRMLRSKGFTDEEIEYLLGRIPKHQIDIASVSWGAFDYREGETNMLIVITRDNPYRQGAVLRQVEYAKARGLMAIRPPRDYREAVEQYRLFRKRFSYWIAGKDNYAYHVLGVPELEAFQVADFYYGFLIDHKIEPQRSQLKNVSDNVLRETISMWIKRLERVSVLTEERDKHIDKLRKVLKLGW